MSSLNSFNKRYARLFGEPVKGDDEEPVDNKWGWYDVLNGVSNGNRKDWDYYLDMNVVAFFNYLAYVTDKERKLKKKQEGLGRVYGNR